MNKEKLSKRLWTGADAIVAFVTLQQVALSTLVIQQKGPLPGLNSWPRQLLAAGLLGVAFFTYGYAARWLGNRSMLLADDTLKDHTDSMRSVNMGRVVFIGWIGATTILRIFWVPPAADG
jgi:hypothetical protein